MKRPALWLASVAFTLLPCLLGCGDQKKTLYKASGTITFDDGSPVQGARLSFSPKSGTVAEGDVQPHANTDENGKFEVSSVVDGDGAPAGDYKVTLSPGTLRPSKPGAAPPAPKQMSVEWSADYMAPDKTPLEVTITSGTNTINWEKKVKKAAPKQ